MADYWENLFRTKIGTIGVYITTRCNFDCAFCYARTPFELEKIGNQEISFEYFKKIIDGIALLGDAPRFVITGGEPFLHPRCVEMVRYAIKKIGAQKVRVTSNLSTIPSDVEGAKKFLKRIEGAQLNMSIDREHLRHDKNAVERIKAIILAAKETNARLGLISVARTKYEKQHPFPQEIARILPAELREKASIRLNFYAKGNKPERQQEIHYWKALERKRTTEIPGSIHASLNSSTVFPAGVDFFPNGRAMINAGRQTYLWFPQLSLGNWKREAIQDILGKNFEMKIELCRSWAGGLSERMEKTYQNQDAHSKNAGAEKKRLEALEKRERQLFARTRIRAIKRKMKRKKPTI